MENPFYSNECRGAGTGGAIAPPIFLEIGEIVAFSTPNISRSKEGTTPESYEHPQYFTPSNAPETYFKNHDYSIFRSDVKIWIF